MMTLDRLRMMLGLTKPKGTAVIMFTHLEEPRVLQHFDRLRREANLPAFLVLHVGDSAVPNSTGDIIVTNGHIAKTFPVRHAQMKRLSRNIAGGFADLVFVTAASDKRFLSFEYLWVLESDVDYSGRWNGFFSLYEDNAADLLACRIRRKHEMPSWSNWKWARTPRYAEPLAAFFPAARISLRLLKLYLKEMQNPKWRGHCEMTLPSVAFANAMKLEDMHGTGEFAARQVRAPLDWQTFGYRPVRSTAFYHEEPAAFAKPNALYHPVKVLPAN